MRIPVVLPTVTVTVDPGDQLGVAVNGEPYAADRALERADLHGVLDEITTQYQSAVRVEVHEADGTTYYDIAIPSEDPEHQPKRRPEGQPVTGPSAALVPCAGITGQGFEAGEEVAIAYVLGRQTAADDGSTMVRLPPALLASRARGLVLLGLRSGVTIQVEAPA